MRIRVKHVLPSDTSVLLTPWRQDFLDLLISLSLRFCLICRICIRQRPLSTGISEDIALTIISLHFPPYPRFQKASTYRCGTKFNLSPRPLKAYLSHPTYRPLGVNMTRTKSMGHDDPSSLPPKASLPSKFSIAEKDVAILPIKQARNLGIYSENPPLSYYTGNLLPTSADFLSFINFDSFSFLCVVNTTTVGQQESSVE